MKNPALKPDFSFHFNNWSSFVFSLITGIFLIYNVVTRLQVFKVCLPEPKNQGEEKHDY